MILADTALHGIGAVVVGAAMLCGGIFWFRVNQDPTSWDAALPFGRNFRRRESEWPLPVRTVKRYLGPVFISLIGARALIGGIVDLVTS